MGYLLRIFFISTLFFSFFNEIVNKSLASNKLEFEWGYENHPQNMVERYTTVFNELPLEFASEADRLLSLKLEGSVG